MVLVRLSHTHWLFWSEAKHGHHPIQGALAEEMTSFFLRNEAAVDLGSKKYAREGSSQHCTCNGYYHRSIPNAIFLDGLWPRFGIQVCNVRNICNKYIERYIVYNICLLCLRKYIYISSIYAQKRQIQNLDGNYLLGIFS